MTESQRKLVKKALIEAKEKRLQKNMNFHDEPVDFSPKFTKKMDKLLKRSEKPYFKFVNTSFKRAIIITAVIATLITACMSISAIREPIKRFFTQIFTTDVNFTYNGTADTLGLDTLASELNVGWLPDGYTEISSDNLSLMSIKEWGNGQDEIELQRFLSLGSQLSVSVDNQHGEYTCFDINELEVNYIKVRNKHYYTWLSNNYSYMLSCTEEFELEDIKKIINGIL